MSEPKIRKKLKSLVEEEIIGKRKISTEGNRYNVYFPLKEMDSDQILEILTE